jgi:hypothetical protein
MENTSGGGKMATVPAEIDRWNWGAFFLNWIWGIGNNTFIALLVFIPFVNFVMFFVLGAKGSSWAWRNKRWESVEAFKATQRKWAQWGFALVALSIVAVAASFFVATHLMKDSDAYKLTVAALQANPEAAAILGKPISTGTPNGSFQVSGPDGAAHFSFSAQGPNGSGTVYTEAQKRLGQWRLNDAVFEDDKTQRRIDLNSEPATRNP